MELINEQAFQDIFKAEVKEFLQKISRCHERHGLIRKQETIYSTAKAMNGLEHLSLINTLKSMS